MNLLFTYEVSFTISSNSKSENLFLKFFEDLSINKISKYESLFQISWLLSVGTANCFEISKGISSCEKAMELIRKNEISILL